MLYLSFCKWPLHTFNQAVSEHHQQSQGQCSESNHETFSAPFGEMQPVF